MKDADFKEVLSKVGSKPHGRASQNATRHYSERFSKETAVWIRKHIIERSIGETVLQPEAKVDTIYGVGIKGKSLDVGVLDKRRYLLLDISIKTFNFKDRRTKNYRHNFTGRFYELLGEELDLRRSYPHATLVALVLLPEDSTRDSAPSSFAHAIRQFSKIAKRRPDAVGEPGFEHVFVAVYDEDGNLYFFNATDFPPKVGAPPQTRQLNIEAMLRIIESTVVGRSELIAGDTLPTYTPYKFQNPL